jgi:hypothetical protein
MKKTSELFKGKLPPPPTPPKPKKAKLPDNDIGSRLELYRKFLNIKGYEFSKHLSISQGSYSDLKNNKSQPSCDTICKIIQLGECDIVWLLTGKK